MFIWEASMILLWCLRRATVEWPETSAAEREYIQSCQLNFWFNQCYNPYAHEYQYLHRFEVLPYWWSEVLAMRCTGDNHCRRFVSSTLHRHWAYAFGSLATFHRRRLVALWHEPSRIPLLLHGAINSKHESSSQDRIKGPERRIKSSQYYAFKVIRIHARTHWLAAVRVILLLGFGGFGDVVDKHIIAQLRDWDVAQCTLRRGSCAADMPDDLCDDSMYIMEEAVERALQGALITYPEGGAGSKRHRLD